MKRTSIITGLLLAVFAFNAMPASADDKPVVPAREFVFCTVCHGIQMGGNVVIQAPRLSGMDAWYVERALRSFKNGWRGVNPDDTYGHEMRPMAAILSPEEIARVSEYVSKAQSAQPDVTIDGDAERGQTLYTSCAACHGADGAGNKALGGPALTGLNDWYLLTQLQNFKSGVRGSHPEDSFGLQMRAATTVLPDEQAMRDVVSYIATLGE